MQSLPWPKALPPPLLAISPTQSDPDSERFSATMLLVISTRPRASIPPAAFRDLLKAMVLLLKTASPALTRPPPATRDSFSPTVLLVSRSWAPVSL